jgi:hypothetical protein
MQPVAIVTYNLLIVKKKQSPVSAYLPREIFQPVLTWTYLFDPDDSVSGVPFTNDKGTVIHPLYA